MDAPLSLEQVIDFLLRTDLFTDLDPSELADLVRIMQVRHVRDGHAVFSEGEEGDAWYVVFQGTVAVTKSTVFGPPRQVAELGSHTCFGEMAVLDGEKRSATVTAHGDATVFRFPRGSFVGLLEEGRTGAFKLVHAMARVLCQRQRQLTQQLSELMAEDRGAIRAQLGDLVDSYTVSE